MVISMKIFVNRKIKRLFGGILLCILFFTLIAVLLMELEVSNAAIYTIACFLLMSAAILALLSGYFRQQHKIMETAVAEIDDYLIGDTDARIECDDESPSSRR